MMYDIFLLKDNLNTMIEEDKNRHPSSYYFDYGDGVNFVLDCLTKITGVNFLDKIT